MDNTVNTF